MAACSGHVGVYSELDKGTTFRLYLPRAEQVTAPQHDRLAVPAARGGSETVLAVEDNDGLRRIVVRQLGDAGYRVLEAADAAAAMAIVDGPEPIHLLLTDIVMPGEMDGRELARIAVARRPLMKVLLTSGFPDARFSGSGALATGTRLLSKPYRKEELRRAVRDAIDEPAR